MHILNGKNLNVWPHGGKWTVSQTVPGTNNEHVHAECWEHRDAELISRIPAMVRTLRTLVEDGECYCIPERSEPCAHCVARGLLKDLHWASVIA